MADKSKDPWVVKDGMDVYHTGHLPKPKLPDFKGTLELRGLPQKAEVIDNWQIAPIPQIAYIEIPPPPPITHYRIQYRRVIHFINRDL